MARKDGLDYRERRIMQCQQRAAHLKARPFGCACPDCLGPGGIREIVDARRRQESERIGEAPF